MLISVKVLSHQIRSKCSLWYVETCENVKSAWNLPEKHPDLTYPMTALGLEEVKRIFSRILLQR